MRCLYCQQSFQHQPTWAGFVKPNVSNGFCYVCEKQLERIKGSGLCRQCGRDLDSLPERFQSQTDSELCIDCEQWEVTGDKLMNRSVFHYNTLMKEVVAKFKFRGDAMLAEGFRAPIREIYRKYFRSYLIIPIPLSDERLNERCFNQAELLAQQLPRAMTPLLLRSIHHAKQSKKNRQERLNVTENPFILNPDQSMPIEGRSILLIDDIYTTGTTVRQAAKILKPLHPSQICSLTLARAEATDE